MKYVTIAAGILLGLCFLMASIPVLFNLMPMPTFPEGTPIAHFMAAFGPTGYMVFIKALELIGGILVAIPKTRNIGLLILGPIIVNIIVYHIFIMGGEGLVHPMLIGICLLALYLLWAERKAFANLVTRNS